MQKKHAYLIAVIAMGLLFLESCKKQDQSLAVAANIEMYKSVIKTWKEAFEIKATNKVKERTETIVAHLNYADAITFPVNKKSTLYLIPLSKFNFTGARYLGIRKRDGVYSLDGLYAASSKEIVQTFYKTGKLPPGEKISVSDIETRPKYEYLVDKKGNAVRASGKAVKKSMASATVKATSITRKSAPSIPEVRPNYVPPIDDEDCWAWYWVYYDPDLGLVWDFIRYTGNCGGGGGDGDGDPPPPPNPCAQGEEDYAQFLDATDGLDTDNYTSSIVTSTISTFKKNKNPTWRPVTNSVNAGFYVSSTEAGVVKYVEFDTGQWRWEWESLTHSSTTVIGGTLIGGVVTLEQSSATSSIVAPATNTLYAGMSLDIKLKCTPKPLSESCPLLNIALVPYYLTFNNCSNIWNATP